jgi:hypothetical protein
MSDLNEALPYVAPAFRRALCDHPGARLKADATQTNTDSSRFTTYTAYRCPFPPIAKKSKSNSPSMTSLPFAPA